jgi:hypothetical protein
MATAELIHHDEEKSEAQAILRALARPIERERVKVKEIKDQRGKVIRREPYITARTVMNRLDDVMGPEHWWDDYIPGENSVVCRLSIRLPGGRVLTKADAGGYAACPDEGDGIKGGYSDAFKRAAVKFGIGREIYGDGSPSYRWPNLIRLAPQTDPEPEAPAELNRGSAPEPDGPEAPEPIEGRDDTRSFWAFLTDEVARLNEIWRDETGEDRDLVTWQESVKWMVQHTADHALHPFDPTEKRKAAQWVQLLTDLSSPQTDAPSYMAWMRSELMQHLGDVFEKARLARAGIE